MEVAPEDAAQNAARGHKGPPLVFKAQAPGPGLLLGVEQRPECRCLRLRPAQGRTPDMDGVAR